MQAKVRPPFREYQMVNRWLHRGKLPSEGRGGWKSADPHAVELSTNTLLSQIKRDELMKLQSRLVERPLDMDTFNLPHLIQRSV